MKEQDPLNDLYKNILYGSAKPGDKERLARWMAGFDATREGIPAEELFQERLKARTELKAHFFPPAKNILLFRSWTVAACFVLITLSMFLLVKMKESLARKNAVEMYSQHSTVPGEKKLIVLADGSRVLINGQSRIKYRKAFIGKTREIYLVGQAYFQVSHDRNKPFIIHAGKLRVQVVGTTFDIKNYPEDPDATVTVGSGKVSVNAGGVKNTWLLSPGQQLSYDQRTGKAAKLEVDTTKFINWKQGELAFSNIVLEEIARQLQRAYGVKIEIETVGLKRRKLTLRVRAKENITQVMEMLATAGGFKYRIKDRIISISK